MTTDRAITYSTLAFINESGSNINGPIDIFVPMVKRVLSLMNDAGVFQGESNEEISLQIEKHYSIKIPSPTLNKILGEIAKQINSKNEDSFLLFEDGAFQIKGYRFVDIEEQIAHETSEILKMTKLFQTFCHANEVNTKSNSLFDFLDQNRESLATYLSDRPSNPKPSANLSDLSLAARFVDYFRDIPNIYLTIKKIYIGSLIVSAVNYEASEEYVDGVLLLDTNFIIALHNLNTKESYEICELLMKSASKAGYKFIILNDTINEIKSLIEAKVRYYDQSILSRDIFPEDIYNACKRRSLSAVDLQRFADNIEDFIGRSEISVVYQTQALRNKAKYSEEFKFFRKIRNSEESAIHDAMTNIYVKEKRGNTVCKDFFAVKSWLVNSVYNRDSKYDVATIKRGNNFPKSIKADDLLNILWLSNPSLGENFKVEKLAELGIASLISMELTSHLPSSAVIRELEDNIIKYGDGEITDKDVLRLSSRIASNQIMKINEVNDLAAEDKKSFVQRIKEESRKQEDLDKRQLEMLNETINEYKSEADQLKKIRLEAEDEYGKLVESLSQSTEKLVKQIIENDKKGNKIDQQAEDLKRMKEKLRNDFERNLIRKWRLNSIYLLVAFLIVFSILQGYIFYIALTNEIAYGNVLLDFQANPFYSLASAVFVILFPFICKSVYDRYNSESNIVNFIKRIEYPDDIK